VTDSIERIGIIVLAAGYSKRFAGDKRQAVLHAGQSVLDTSLSRIPDTYSRRILVLHPGDEKLAEKYSSQWSICIAEAAQQGLGHSLAAAIKQAENWQAAVIALADMPYVQTETYRLIQRSLLDHSLVRPYCQGRPGNPVGIGAEYFTQLEGLSGDSGARKILQQNAASLFRLDCSDWGITQDIDTRSALPSGPV
tara:strand:- start:7339 stop:7923 length:585 start_codon:yes stop_codon:yes gene_type:complete